MAINTLEYAKLFQTQLDLAAQRDALTGWMESNAGQVKYSGGDEVKIPKMTVQGLADYDRDDGYTQGSVTLTYETLKMTQDRGRKFQLDSMDVDETNFVSTAGAVMGEFQRTQVIPEIDAYRLSAIATKAINGSDADNMVEYGYTAKADTSALTVLRHIKTGTAKIRAKGFNGTLVCHIDDLVLLELELELAGKLQSMTWSQGGINTTVPAIDGTALIATPSNRLYTSIKINDGKTSGQEAGGYTKGSTAKSINFEIMPIDTPIAVSKQNKMRIFDPKVYQKADAWSMDYRRYHDLWVKDNAVDSIYVSIKEAKSA